MQRQSTVGATAEAHAGAKLKELLKPLFLLWCAARLRVVALVQWKPFSAKNPARKECKLPNNDLFNELRTDQIPEEIFAAYGMPRCVLSGCINDWVLGYLPNASISKRSGVRRRAGSRLQRVFELPFGGRFGRWCESFAARVARRRIDTHYVGGREDHRARVLERFESGHELRFHNHPDLRGLRDRYADHRATLEADLKLAIDEGEVAR